MELDEALSRISDIRRQMARTEVFRGYRSITTAFSGMLAIGAAMAQPWLIVEPSANVMQFVELWAGVAALSVLVVGIEIAIRIRKTQSPLQRELSLVAVEQFAPAMVLGALMTYAILNYSPAAISLIPGLWTVLFSLGIFASRRTLPRPTMAIAGFYALAGLFLIARHSIAFEPWAMGSIFGIGQILAAVVLYASLERNHE